jgi:NAD(P)-dependent dehydrogenase (short-subunit alcohol dehydrogenase family)
MSEQPTTQTTTQHPATAPRARVTSFTLPYSLSGKTAVVTGAARGIGAAVALGLARRGAQVALVGLEPDELAATTARCAWYAPARAWTADVTDRERMQEVAGEIAGYFGRVDIVVANAGIAIGGLFADSDPVAFDRVIEVNLLGSVATARAFLPALTAARGYYLQVASLAALAPAPLMAAYCASKAGVEAFAHALRAEVAPRGVDVGVAYLTWTDTDMVRAADADEVLGQMRARLPWPASQTAPLEPAVDRLVAGISRRAAFVYGQPWIRGLQWLPRVTLPAAIARRGPREVGRLDGAAPSRRPLGPGGRAASAPAPAH